MQINGYLRCRLTKNSPRRTTSTPAGVFCTLLASTSPICKKAGYIWQTVNLPRLFQKRIVLKNSPRRIKSGTDADGSKQKRVYFTLPASTPPVSKKAYFKKTNKNTYCKKHSIQLFYKQLSPITHTDRKKRYSVPYVFYIGMSFRIGTGQSKPLSRRKSKGIPNNNKTARNAKDYKRMSYEASLKTLCVLGVLRG